jgi:hypothetical protein
MIVEARGLIDEQVWQCNLATKEWGLAAVDNESEPVCWMAGSKRPRISSTVIASHFPTVFMLREFEGGEALNRKLTELMLQLEKETVNIASHTTNIGGYHSETNFFTRNEPELGSLRELIQQAVDDYLPKFLAANCRVPPANLRSPECWSCSHPTTSTR